jgi:hypothetical protein
MPKNRISPELETAIDKIKEFIHTVTGQAANDSELADALTRYFVLNEITGHIQMARDDGNNVTD